MTLPSDDDDDTSNANIKVFCLCPCISCMGNNDLCSDPQEYSHQPIRMSVIHICHNNELFSAPICKITRQLSVLFVAAYSTHRLCPVKHNSADGDVHLLLKCITHLIP